MIVPTTFGDARATWEQSTAAPAGVTAVLLHGAGTDTSTPLLAAVARGLADAGVPVLRVDQPYTLAAKRRPPAPTAQLDAVLIEVLLGQQASGRLLGEPVVVIGRSSGSRVACRVAATAAEVFGIVQIAALAFPLVPPGGTTSRAAELAGARVPVLVLQGSRDEFGTPAEISALGLPHVTVREIEGADHLFVARRRDRAQPAGVQAEVVGQVVQVALAAA